MVTPIYAALLSVLLVVLFLRVVRLRWVTKTGIGDGGNENLQRAIRAHGNFVETVPWILILMILQEQMQAGFVWLHFYGCVLILARLAHAWGLSHSAGTTWGRASGVLLFLILILTGALNCLLLAL
jgi:uncharacterized membrane protein YecN with MAPEG domain